MLTVQRLTFTFDGITAGDYLAHVRNPEPPGLGGALRSLVVEEADPLGDTLVFVVTWNGPAPAHADAEVLAGLPVIPEVADVRCPRLALAA